MSQPRTNTPPFGRAARMASGAAAIALVGVIGAAAGCTNHGREFHPEYVLGAAALVGIGMVAPATFDDRPPPQTAEEQLARWREDRWK